MLGVDGFWFPRRQLTKKAAPKTRAPSHFQRVATCKRQPRKSSAIQPRR